MPWVEWSPDACPACGAKWKRPYSRLVSSQGTPEGPERIWICRTCDVTTARSDLGDVPEWDERYLTWDDLKFTPPSSR